MHNLQRLVGNQAVQRLVDVQREEDEGAESESSEPAVAPGAPPPPPEI
jgi:hypothetical protein